MRAQPVAAASKAFDPFTEDQIDDCVAVTLRVQILSAQVRHAGVVVIVTMTGQHLPKRDVTPVVEVQLFGLPAGLTACVRGWHTAQWRHRHQQAVEDKAVPHEGVQLPVGDGQCV